MPEYAILQPDERIFKNSKNQVERILGERQAIFITERIEYTLQGTLRFNLLAKFPEKGFPTPERIAAVNIVKRITLSLLMPLASKEIILPLVGFVLTPYKKKISLIEKILSHYLRMTEQILGSCLLEDERYILFCQELITFVCNFITGFGISYDIAHRTAVIFATLIEYDNAYRLRIEDLLYETSKEKLSLNPRKEIQRLIKSFINRESGFDPVNGLAVGDRFVSFGKLLSYILLIPKVKKVFKTTVQQSNFKRLQMDESDSYYCLVRSDYNFFGESVETRLKRWMEIHHNNVPPQILVNG